MSKCYVKFMNMSCRKLFTKGKKKTSSIYISTVHAVRRVLSTIRAINC